MLKQKLFYISIAAALLAPFFTVPQPSEAQLSLIRPIIFPIAGQANFSDDFGDPRSGGRTHEGNDIFAKKMTPLVAVVDGTISFVNYPEPNWGYAVGIRDKDGYSYWYLHINNDTPGTDNGSGDGFFAYAPDIVRGNRVVKGQLIGWVGDSGNAETTPPHLHFEIHAPGGEPMNPYQSLKAAPRINVPVTDYPALPGEILPYGQFAGAVNLAAGNLDGDRSIELVTAPGASGGPHLRAFKRDGKPLASFYAYDPNFHGGVDVATGDIDDDGKDEIITAPGPGGGPHVKVFKADGTLVKEFFAYDPNFHGGVRVSTVDFDDDDKAEIITAPAGGGGPHVKVFKADGTLVKEFFAYDPNFHGGVDVAGMTEDGDPYIATAPGPGGGPHVKIFNENGQVTEEFMAYEGNFSVGLHLSAGKATSDRGPQIAVLPATGAGPHLKIFDFNGSIDRSAFTAFEPWWRGGYDLAAEGGSVFIVTSGGRRASVRVAFASPASSDPDAGCRRNRCGD